MLFKITLIPFLCAVLAHASIEATTFSGKHCHHDNQGTTSIEGGTTGVVKMSNANSILLDPLGSCEQVEFHYFHVEECGNPGMPPFKSQQVNLRSGGKSTCHELPKGDHKCAKITCTKSS